VKAFEIEGHITIAAGEGGFEKIMVHTPWSVAEIYAHGAHVTHFQKSGEAPLLFMSGQSVFEKGKPIRGGVPVIYPWFGPRDGFEAHGFARTTDWILEESSIFEGGTVLLRFRLPTEDPLLVEYVIRVNEYLSLELIVTNEGQQEVNFETCLHTYFNVGAIGAVALHGLEEQPYYDKVLNCECTQTAEPITISEEVDRVFSNTEATVKISDTRLNRRIMVAKTGSHSTVVWNPWILKSQRMSDFGDDEYQRMICVESGNVRSNKIVLPNGSRAVMKVKIRSEKLH
jgi:glucose-6-phosphate 1-epimerase